MQFLWFILPKKIFRKFISDKIVYVPNPLKQQIYHYRKCGCGSRQKVKFCCGRTKLVSVEKYKIMIKAMEKWIGSQDA